MKIILAFAILVFTATDSKTVAQKIVKKDLVFMGIENTNGGWQLKFADKNNNAYFFNAQRSNTEPYIFYTRTDDGSLKLNEKIKDNWFSISYFILKTGEKEEKIITKLESVTEPKKEPEKLNI